MFTFKAYRHDSLDKTVICGARYSVTHGPRTSIWIYPTHRQENPVLIDLFHTADAENVYREIFVENEAGKTIDRYRAYAQPEPCVVPADQSELSA